MNTNRRYAIASLALLPIAGALTYKSHVWDADVDAEVISGEKWLLAGMEQFLSNKMMPDSLRCGARRGDGAPQYSDVEAFKNQLQGKNFTSETEVAAHLETAHEIDFAHERIQVVDGWIMSETEVFAASIVMLAHDQDCVLT